MLLYFFSILYCLLAQKKWKLKSGPRLSPTPNQDLKPKIKNLWNFENNCRIFIENFTLQLLIRMLLVKN